MPTPPRPVTKIITQRIIQPLSRADMSKSKPQKPVPVPVEEPLEDEGPEDASETKDLEDVLVESISEGEGPISEPLPPPTPPKKDYECGKCGQAISHPQRHECLKKETAVENTIPNTKPKTVTAKEDPVKDLDEALDNAEADLAFLAMGEKKVSSPKKSPPVEAPVDEEQEFYNKKIKSDLHVRTPKIEQVPVSEDFFQDDDTYKEGDQKVSLSFNRKYESCYLNQKLNKPLPTANIFLREVTKDSQVFHSIVKASNIPNPNLYISSPFKFFEKQSFVQIFQKAFIGTIFDLSYATPYYYTREGTHHIYLSSQIVEEDEMPHFVLLDLIPNKPRFYEKRDLLKKEDFIDFTVSRILLVSANVLYL